MTLLQLRLAVEAAAQGSISAAAQKLQLSQPNASQSIKKLEEELGYIIFDRTEGRTVPTEQGFRFLEHAEKMLREDAAIRSISHDTAFPRLRVGVMNYSPAINAFLRFIAEERDEPFCDLTCVNVSPEQGAELLRERQLDIIISLQLKTTLPSLEKICRENRLSLTRHGNLQICVRVRKDHPLITGGVLDGSLKGFQALGQYPYAEYRHMDNIYPFFQPGGGSPFGFSYKIYADERDLRLKIVRSSNAYSIGIQIPQQKLDEYGLAAFPIGNEQAILCSCVRRGEDDLPTVCRYRDLLMEEAAGE